MDMMDMIGQPMAPLSGGIIMSPSSTGSLHLATTPPIQAMGTVGLYPSSPTFIHSQAQQKIIVPVYQEPQKIRIPVYTSPPPSPPASFGGEAPPKLKTKPPDVKPRDDGRNERGGAGPDAENLKVKILEVGQLVEVPVEVPVEKVVVKIIEVPIQSETIIVKAEPQIITKEVIKEVIKEVPIEVTREIIKEVPVPYRDSSERRSPPVEKKVQATGLGMLLERQVGNSSPSETVVSALIPGYAAHYSGLVQVGDILEAIDETDISAWSLDHIKEITVAPEGTSSKCRLRRRGMGGSNLFEVTLTRVVPAVIRPNTQEMDADNAYKAVSPTNRNSFNSEHSPKPVSGRNSFATDNTYRVTGSPSFPRTFDP